MAKLFSIKFPITAEDEMHNTFIDMATNRYDSLRADITHLLFTPSGTRLRNPAFGSNLMKMLFNPNDDFQKSSIQQELTSVLKRWVPAANLTDLELTINEDGRGITIHMKYDVNEGNFTVSDEINLTI
jgi:phage baseplate assembly protein W